MTLTGALRHVTCICLAQDVTLTAVNVDAAQAVGVAGSVRWAALDWACPEEFLAREEPSGGWDVIFGSDIVYHQQFDFGPVHALAALLARIVAAARDAGRAPPTILFGYQERDSAARVAFWDALAGHGLGVTVQTLEDIAAEGRVDVSGLLGPMALWFIAPSDAAPAEAAP